MSASTTSAFVSSRKNAYHTGQDHGTRGTDRVDARFDVEWDQRVRAQSEITAEFGVKCSTRRPTRRQLAVMANAMLIEAGQPAIELDLTDVRLNEESDLDFEEWNALLEDVVDSYPGDWIPSIHDLVGSTSKNTGQHLDPYEGGFSEEICSIKDALYGGI